MLLGGNYVNRFSIQGRSYKVIPQIERAERLTPDQLSQIYITGVGRPARAAVDVRDPEDHRRSRGSCKKFQQLNAVRDPGRDPAAGAARPGAQRSSRTRRGRSLPAGLHHRLRGRVAAAAHRGRRLPRDVPAVGDPDLPGAGGAVRELPRSVHHPRGLGAARRRRARCCSRSSGFTTLNIYSQVGLITLVGLIAKNGILIVAVRQPPAGDGDGQARRDRRGGGHAAAADPDDDRGDRRRSLPAGPRDRPRRGRAQQHRHHARERHGHRHDLHAVRRAVDLHAGGAHARRRRAGTDAEPAREREFTEAVDEGQVSEDGSSHGVSAFAAMVAAEPAFGQAGGSKPPAADARTIRADARRRRAPRHRQQPRSRRRPARHGSRGGASRRRPARRMARCSRPRSADRAS